MTKLALGIPATPLLVSLSVSIISKMRSHPSWSPAAWAAKTAAIIR